MTFKKKQKTEIPDAAVIEAAAEPTLEEAPDLPIPDESIVEVWERRFNNPGEIGSAPIALTLPGMVTRWINTTIEGRYHRAVYSQGWQPVEKKLLVDPEAIPDLYNHPHGIVCRGEKGKEVLMMMPEKVFQRIRQRKAQIVEDSFRQLRSEVAQAAASKFGPEAGDFIYEGKTADGQVTAIGSVHAGRERVSSE